MGTKVITTIIKEDIIITTTGIKEVTVDLDTWSHRDLGLTKVGDSVRITGERDKYDTELSLYLLIVDAVGSMYPMVPVLREEIAYTKPEESGN